jgi:nucleotide-binding universal stress UspA family protein
MATFDNILAAIDFSEHSRAALGLAVELSQELGAKLYLLHCYPIEPGGLSPYGIALPTDYYSDLRDAAAKQLREWREQYVPAELDVEVLLSSDEPSAAVVQAAETADANLIVMGTRGLSGIKHVVLGSIAERTIRSAPCPVLTVKCDR